MKKEYLFRIRLCMKLDSWGCYVKGDIQSFIFNLLNEQNGLLNFPIEQDRWEIVSCDLFTGLKDINFVDIFEGDIVRWDDGSNGEKWRVAVVEMNPDIQFRIIKIESSFKQSGQEGYVFHYGNFAYKDTQRYLEVIGNIHKLNP